MTLTTMKYEKDDVTTIRPSRPVSGITVDTTVVNFESSDGENPSTEAKSSALMVEMSEVAQNIFNICKKITISEDTRDNRQYSCREKDIVIEVEAKTEEGM